MQQGCCMQLQRVIKLQRAIFKPYQRVCNDSFAGDWAFVGVFVKTTGSYVSANQINVEPHSLGTSFHQIDYKVRGKQATFRQQS